MWLPLLLCLASQTLPARRDILAPVQRTDVRLSVDGKRVGWLEPDEAGVRQLVVAAVHDPTSPKAVTDGDSPVLQWRWAFSNEHVVFTRVVDGGNTHLLVSAKDGGSVFDATPDGRGPMLLAGHGRQWRTHVALEYEPKDEDAGLWLVDFVTKESHRMCDGGFERYVFDGNMWPAGASGPRDSGQRIARMKPSGEWTEIASFGHTAGKVAGVVAADFSGGTLFFVAPHDRDRAALHAVDLDDGTITVLAEHERADLLPFGVQIDARTRTPVSAVTSRGGLERVLVDPEACSEDWKGIAAAIDGEVHFAGQDLTGSRWLLTATTGGPRTYYLYDREGGDLKRLFSEVPALDETPLATRGSFEARARDGRLLPCGIYLPPGADSDGDGRPEEPLPTVVFVHGGPWSLEARDDWSTHRHLSLLASRGYCVLMAEFRGAVGFGRGWVDQGDGELGDGMIEDIVDATRAAVSEKIADPDALAVFGWSYGGYAVLRTMTREPDLFACGLALAPLSDLLALQQGRQDKPEWRELWNRRVGDPNTDEGARRLRNQSPIHSVEALAAPLLMASGSLDLVVPKSQSDSFARAAHGAGKPITYLVYGAEPHDFRRLESWVSWWATAEHFLAKHLGGRSQPYGRDVKDAAVVIAVGAEHVPGLAKAAK